MSVKSSEEQQTWAAQERRFRETEEQIGQRWFWTAYAVFPFFSLVLCWFTPNVPLWMRVSTSVLLMAWAVWLIVRAVRVWVLTFRFRHESLEDDVPQRLWR